MQNIGTLYTAENIIRDEQSLELTIDGFRIFATIIQWHTTGELVYDVTGRIKQPHILRECYFKLRLIGDSGHLFLRCNKPKYQLHIRTPSLLRVSTEAIDQFEITRTSDDWGPRIFRGSWLGIDYVIDILDCFEL